MDKIYVFNRVLPDKNCSKSGKKQFNNNKRESTSLSADCLMAPVSEYINVSKE